MPARVDAPTGYLVVSAYSLYYPAVDLDGRVFFFARFVNNPKFPYVRPQRKVRRFKSNGLAVIFCEQWRDGLIQREQYVLLSPDEAGVAVAA